METKEITLGGVTYTIQELPRRKNAAWREQLRQDLAPVAGFLERVPTLEVNTGAEAADLIRGLLAGVNGALDRALELILAYSPALLEDRERIEAEAHDSEIVGALLPILELAYPFGTLAQGWDLQRLIALGQRAS